MKKKHTKFCQMIYQHVQISSANGKKNIFSYQKTENHDHIKNKKEQALDSLRQPNVQLSPRTYHATAMKLGFEPLESNWRK